MNHTVGVFLILLPGLAARATACESPGRQPATPEQQYNALLQQYNDAFKDYSAAFREAKLPADREKTIREMYPRPGKWAARFLELVEKYPDEPFVEDALVWIMTSEARLKRFLP